MIELKENQCEVILKHGDAYYVCIIETDKTPITLKSYSKIPFIKVDPEKGVKLELGEVEKTMKRIAEYDISNSISGVNEPHKYMEFVKDLRSQIYKLSSLQEFRAFVGAYLDDKALEGLLDEYIVQLDKKVRMEETVFKDQIVSQVPTNWPYAMFPESSWAAYEDNVQLFHFAQGDTTIYADTMGMTLDDIKRYFSGDKAKEEMEIYNGLNDQVKKISLEELE